MKMSAGHHHHQSTCSESNAEAGGLSQMMFGEDGGTQQSLLTPSSGMLHGPAESSSPSLMAKSLLGKLTIRKPSLLSIASNLSSPGAAGSGGENKNGQFGGSLENIEKGNSLLPSSYSQVDY